MIRKEQSVIEVAATKVEQRKVAQPGRAVAILNQRDTALGAGLYHRRVTRATAGFVRPV